MPEAATDNRRPDSEEQEIEREEQNALQALRELTADEDTPSGESRSKITLASILGGDILGGRWFRRQFWYIVRNRTQAASRRAPASTANAFSS